MTLRELRSSTATLDRFIQRDGTVVVTNHGKPSYVMLGVDQDNLEETLVDLRRIRAKRAVSRMQATSTRLGNDTLTTDEVNAIISDTRNDH